MDWNGLDRINSIGSKNLIIISKNKKDIKGNKSDKLRDPINKKLPEHVRMKRYSFYLFIERALSILFVAFWVEKKGLEL